MLLGTTVADPMLGWDGRHGCNSKVAISHLHNLRACTPLKCCKLRTISKNCVATYVTRTNSGHQRSDCATFRADRDEASSASSRRHATRPLSRAAHPLPDRWRSAKTVGRRRRRHELGLGARQWPVESTLMQDPRRCF